MWIEFGIRYRIFIEQIKCTQHSYFSVDQRTNELRKTNEKLVFHLIVWKLVKVFQLFKVSDRYKEKPAQQIEECKNHQIMKMS